MAELFLTVLKMSLAASVVALVVILARLCLRRVPKIFSYVLWSVVLLRLVCPLSFSITLPFGWLPETESVLQSMSEQGKSDTIALTVDSAITKDGGESIKAPMDEATQPVDEKSAVASETPAVEAADGDNMATINRSFSIIPISSIIWLLGVAAIVFATLVSYALLKKRLAFSIRKRANIYGSDRVKNALVLGVFSPRIYLPCGLSAEQERIIVLHEETHISRQDHVVKLIAYAALCVHWFNPVVWLSYFLMTTDMESACDEAVVAKLSVCENDMETNRRKYCMVMIEMLQKRELPYSAAFSGVGAKSRIRNIICHKRRAPVAITAAMLAVTLTFTACIMNPVREPAAGQNATGILSGEDSDTSGAQTVTADGYELLVYSDYAVVTSYTGTGIDIEIPREYNGVPITIIGERAFAGLSLSSVKLPNTIKSIRAGAFDDCKSLSSVRWPSGLLRIEDHAFRNSALSEILLPDSIRHLGEYCFSGCTQASKLYIPAGLIISCYPL